MNFKLDDEVDDDDEGQDCDHDGDNDDVNDDRDNVFVQIVILQLNEASKRSKEHTATLRIEESKSDQMLLTQKIQKYQYHWGTNISNIASTPKRVGTISKGTISKQLSC